MPGNLFNLFDADIQQQAAYQYMAAQQAFDMQNMALREHQHQALSQQDLRQLSRASQRQLRTILIGVNEEQLFWRCPVVSYLVDKIPAASAVIKPNQTTLAYLSQAKAEGYPLRKQCEDLGIPWSARLIDKACVSQDAVMAAVVLKPSPFSQSLPNDVTTNKWAGLVVSLYKKGGSDSALNWLARHYRSIQSTEVLDYLAQCGEVAITTKPDTIFKRNRDWHDQIHRSRSMAEIDAYRQYGEAKPKRDAFHYRGFDFIPLKTAEDFYQEGREQRNCVMSRFPDAVYGRYHYYSMRKDGRRVATVQYDADRIVEIKAACNKAVEPEIANIAQVAWQSEPEQRILPPAKISRPSLGRRAVNLIADSTSWTGR